LGINLVRQTYLHQCDDCGTFWEQRERFADTVSAGDAMRLYPEFVEE
jgi:hypothetical protein